MDLLCDKLLFSQMKITWKKNLKKNNYIYIYMYIDFLLKGSLLVLV